MKLEVTAGLKLSALPPPTWPTRSRPARLRLRPGRRRGRRLGRRRAARRGAAGGRRRLCRAARLPRRFRRRTPRGCRARPAAAPTAPARLSTSRREYSRSKIQIFSRFSCDGPSAIVVPSSCSRRATMPPVARLYRLVRRRSQGVELDASVRSHPVTTRAAVLHVHSASRTRSRRSSCETPGRGEVLVRIVAAGICHSDVGQADGEWAYPLPAVLGHEGSGVVEAVGPGVDRMSSRASASSSAWRPDAAPAGTVWSGARSSARTPSRRWAPGGYDRLRHRSRRRRRPDRRLRAARLLRPSRGRRRSAA